MQNNQNNFKDSKLYRNFKENRAVYITAITLLVALAVIVSVTAVANRSKKPPKETETESNIITETETETKAPASTDVMDKLPTFVLPVNGTLAKTHDATTQVFSDTMQDYRVHLGIDITTETGAPVYAAAEGTVAQIWEDALMGQCIAVKHNGDAYTIYKNLSTTLPEDIKEGTAVPAGKLIGYVGETAMIEMADEPHLHFEMTVGGLAQDPLDYFEEQAVATLAQDNNYED